MRLDLAGHRAFAMATAERLRRAVRGELKQAGVARLDLVAQRRSLAIGDGDVACRGRVAPASPLYAHLVNRHYRAFLRLAHGGSIAYSIVALAAIVLTITLVTLGVSV